MNQHNEQVSTDVNQQITNAEDVVVSTQLSRRKFLTRAGVGSLPVIMSIQSGSAWGCVDLACKPGDSSLSNSASGVASATAAHPKQFIKPKWSSLRTVRDVLYADFDEYLKRAYKHTLCTKSGKNYTVIDKTKCSTWWNTVKSPSTALYIRQPANNNKWNYFLYTDDRTVPAFSNVATFNGILLDSTVKFSAIFGGSDSTTFGTLLTNKPNKLETYIAAAYIGSIWERHAVYTQKYPGRPLCYPSPADIISIYQTRSTRPNGHNDLFGLMKLYTPIG